MTTQIFILSLFAFFALASITGAAILLLLFKKNRPRYISYWATGSILTGVGVILVMLKAELPEFIWYKFANALVVSGAVLVNFSLASLAGEKIAPRAALIKTGLAFLLLIGSLVAVSEVFGSIHQPIVIALTSSILSFYGAYFCLKIQKQIHYKLASTLTIAFLLFGTVWFIRLLTLASFNVGFATDGGLINVFTFTALLFLGLMRYIVFIGLVVGISEDEKYQLAESFNQLKLDIANDKVAISEQQLRYVLNATGDGVWDWNILTGEVKHNPRWLEMLGEDSSQPFFSVDDFKSRIHPNDLDLVQKHLNLTLEKDVAYLIQYRMIRRDGRQIWVQDAGSVVERSTEGRPIRMVGAISDITKDRVAEEKIQNLIYFDSLTGLPNRQFIHRKFKEILSQPADENRFMGLMYIDLDQFKIINDTYGHQTGDVLLQKFSDRIQGVARPTDVVSRIGGDEFLLLIQGDGSSYEATKLFIEEVASRIFKDLAVDFNLGKNIFAKTTVSIGIVIFTDDKAHFDPLLKSADIAMYAAKESMDNSYCFFDEKLSADFERRSELFSGLGEASKLDQFYIEYQPIVDQNKQCFAYEALARWRHPSLGNVMPDDFIPFAEKSGQIMEVGEAILKEIFSSQAILSHIKVDGGPYLFINISATQLMNVGFVDQFFSLCEKYDVPVHKLHLEITEGAYLSNIDAAIRVINRFTSKGVRFILDDFGTGYSSLAYLQKLPIQYIKLDKSFVSGIVSGREYRVLAKNIMSLADSLGLEVIAEGVETEEQFEMLLLQGSHYFQGWYFGRPEKLLS